MLGQLTVTGDDGRDLRAGELPRRARQVLGALAARHDRIQSKDALADAVWGEDLPANHAAALEHYVSTLRRRLQPGRSTGDSFIVTRAGGYLLDTSRTGLDLAELRDAGRRADALPPGDAGRVALRDRALDLARDLPFVEDEYADWAAAARAEVRDARLAALCEVGEATTDPGRALRLARDAIELDPFLERAYRLAMRSSAAAGHLDEALRWFDRCRRRLGDELRLTPSAETVRLRGELLASRVGSGGIVAAARFVGRTAEIAAILQSTERVIEVVGPIGAGKSALLMELARRAPGRVGVGVALGGPVRLTWLRTAFAQLGGDPSTIEGPEPLGEDVLEAVAAVLDRPDEVLLAVDEAEKLDAAGVTELAWLLQRCPRLKAVVTYRYPSAIVGTPLESLTSGLVLRLAPLGPGDLGDPDVLERTGGIPALVAAPDGTGRAVAMHIARVRCRWMPPVAWDVLRLTASLGPLDVNRLGVLTGRPPGPLLDVVDQLVHAHLLVEEPGGRFGHRSGLVREAVAEQMSDAHSAHLRTLLS